MRRLICLLAMALIGCGAFAAGPNFPCGTQVLVGSLRDWKNALLKSSDSVSVRLVNAGGTVIAETTVVDPDPSGQNFRLEVPISVSATDRTVASGDKLNCVLVTDAGISIGADPLTVGDANSVSNMTLKLVDVTAITNASGSAVLRVPTEYLDNIASWLEAFGYGRYDPWSDYDGDGQSNYAEFMAGTNPFDAHDKLRVVNFSVDDVTEHVISFEYVGGHLYGISASPSLTEPKWTQAEVRTAPAGTPQKNVLPSADADDVGIATIYIIPASGTDAGFYKLEAK